MLFLNFLKACRAGPSSKPCDSSEDNDLADGTQSQGSRGKMGKYNWETLANDCQNLGKMENCWFKYAQLKNKLELCNVFTKKNLTRRAKNSPLHPIAIST